MDVREGYVPGVVARLTELHTTYYGELWELGPQFEVEMAEGIAEFVGRYEPEVDGLWTVVDDERTVRGGIVIDSRRTGEAGAQLRYLILDPALHGNGLGRRLLERAMAFCHEKGYERVFLWTVDELEAAVRLYRNYGFEATDTVDTHTGWETDVPYRLYEYEPRAER
jgi:GNAT superfamily N-acetyltransferase